MLKNRIEMRDHSAEGRLFFRRTLVAYIGMVALMLVLLANLYYLQVESYETYQTRSNDNRIRVVPVAPPRGLIYDANGVLLAENRPVYSLEIVPEETENLEKTADDLITLLAPAGGDQGEVPGRGQASAPLQARALFEKLTEYQVAPSRSTSITTRGQHRGLPQALLPVRRYPHPCPGLCGQDQHP